MTLNSERLEKPAPAVRLGRDSAKMALDELFTLAGKYNLSDAYLELLRFVGRFRFYSPFNAMLIYTQMPGAQFACTARRWRKDYHREIKISARPIVILQPMGPVLFVFDVSDTAPLPNAAPLPLPIEAPFRAKHGKIAGKLALTTENSRLGVDTASDEYLAAYVRRCPATPSISLDRVLKSVWLLERMGRTRLGPRDKPR